MPEASETTCAPATCSSSGAWIASAAGIAAARARGRVGGRPQRLTPEKVAAAEAMRAGSLSQEQIFSGMMDAKVTSLFALAAMRVRENLRAAQKIRVPRAHLPALLVVALSPLYLKRMTRPGFDPFRDATDIAVHRRQLAMLAAMLRRRV